MNEAIEDFHAALMARLHESVLWSVCMYVLDRMSKLLRS
jgi:hypothetical protein